MKNLIFLFFAVISFQLSAQISDTKLDEIINQLSNEEKVYIVLGTGMNIPEITGEFSAPQAVVGTTDDKVPGAAGTSYLNKKFGFPAVVLADGPAGIRISPERKEFPDQTFYATAFPIGTSISSSWNIELAKEVGAAFGREGKDYGVDFLLGPALNIQRNPLGGRNFEYYSEDPVLAGKITAGFVNGVQSEGVGGTIKHFVANNSETNRTELNTVVSQRALREIYLKGFEIAIKESNPWSVMSSYNRVNGVYTSESEDLLTEILRNEWNFDGFVMTDWFAGKDAVAQIKAGNDLLMPGTIKQEKSLLEALENGDLEEAIIDRNIKYILKQYFKTYSFNNYKPTGKPDLEFNKKIARNAATEGMILLKNNDALPIATTSKIALFGVTSFETIAGGTGSGDVNKAYMVSVNEGLNNGGYVLDKQLVADYETYIKEEKVKIPPKAMFFEKDILIKENLWSQERLQQLANANDVAVFTLGRTSGEFEDRTLEGDFNLTAGELELIKNISEAFRAENKKFIVILNIGGVIETDSWKQYADAILLTWQSGQEAGNAISDILLGAKNPSGKLTVTFPINLNSVPSTKNFPGKVLDSTANKPKGIMAALPSEEIYEEGIYVGYRYFDSFNVETSFPFGFGLSYTNFEYSNLSLTKTANDITIEFTVTNSGETAGKEVAQLYVSSPEGALEKPKKELKGFAKTKLLNSGESEKVKITVNINDLGYYDTNSLSWKLDQGAYKFLVGKSSQDIVLTSEVNLDSKIIETTLDLLKPTIKINELRKN